MTSGTTSGRTKAAVIQMISTDQVEPNLAQMERLVRAAAEDRASLVVVPECFAYLGSDAAGATSPGKAAIAERLPPQGDPSDAPILSRCAALAKELSVELVLGGFWERGEDPKKVKNACVHLDARGEVRAVYRKIHLFDVDLADGTKLQESASVEPGTELVVTDSAIGKLGLSVCYDVRFPELYRGLVDRGATALTVPAAFTLTTGKDHWHVLLRARAIESQCYVLAAAQTGRHSSASAGATRQSYGHALIIDPWGTVLAECGEGEGYACAWIDDAVVQRIRTSLPSLAHRRLR
ncbi:MAG: carbon-nitrogen hydrolase family protein [Deltaproteobacteria bacterium]|nr:carbon-nitrogen hydrolase family protein [Deltaproteobacteria bacterium]